MKRTRMAALAALALVLVLGSVPAGAASGGECVVSGGVVLSNPISLTPTTGTYNFTSSTTLTCVGAIGGTAVAGGGGVTSPGNYGNGALRPYLGADTCDHGSGNGTFNANVPRVGGGALNVTGAYNFIRLGTIVILNGTASANNQTAPLAGMFQFTPDLGQTCVTTPVRTANVTGLATVAGP